MPAIQQTLFELLDSCFASLHFDENTLGIIANKAAQSGLICQTIYKRPAANTLHPAANCYSFSYQSSFRIRYTRSHFSALSEIFNDMQKDFRKFRKKIYQLSAVLYQLSYNNIIIKELLGLFYVSKIFLNITTIFH